MPDKQSRGFTLVEIMIAIAISSILMLGVTQIFSANKRGSMISNGLGRIQENARYAMRKLTQDMRMAGYTGCSGKYDNHLDKTDPAYDDDLFEIENATGGWEYTGGSSTSVTQPGVGTAYQLPSSIALDSDATNWEDTDDGDALPASLVARAIPGSDVLILKWAAEPDSSYNFQVKNMNTTKEAINTVAQTNIPAGTIVIITDCSQGDIFQNTSNANASSVARGTAGSHKPGNTNPGSTNWSHNYPSGATLLQFISRAYFIGIGASGEPALWRATYIEGTATGIVYEEIAEGIENMQVLYGEDVNAVNDTADDDNDVPPTTIDRYVTAQQLTDHFHVAGLKVALLARSTEEVKQSASSDTYTLLDTPIASPSDRRMRYVFTSTVKLRNRGIK
ncbi:MAG: PilW family protein [Thioalkalispiraceae bacterium]|jgi:type IV pilus assembly protein PilW